MITLKIEWRFWLPNKNKVYCQKAPVWAFKQFFNKYYKMEYTMKDGRTFSAETKEQLVQLMRADSRTESEDDKDFMIEVSRRCFLDTEANIRTSSYADFIEDLIKEEFIIC